MQRRLAAILAADVAGYSRMMGEDEVGTLAALQACHSELVAPAVARHHGRVVKLMGDGVLAEFASVVEAVACAAEVQRDMATWNRAASGKERMTFRIGVHLGDVIAENDDIYGDGVNIAARLEGVAEPGDICISRQAFDQIDGNCRSRSAISVRGSSRTSPSRSRYSRSTPTRPVRRACRATPSCSRKSITAGRPTACGSPGPSSAKGRRWSGPVFG